MQHGKGNLNNLEDKIRTFVAVLLRQRIAKFHTEIFIGQMHLTHTIKQSHVQWAEIDLERYLRLDDNTQITEDRYYKVRVLFEKLNVNHSIDENIIYYYGKHSTE